jgi:glyoxylase-like metal-dependent hydrolase (beta-lactamase superfamily II)
MRGAFIDPGGDLDKLLNMAAEKSITIEKILITHGHLDHCGQAGLLAERLHIPIEGPHQDDQFWIDQLEAQCEAYGFPGGRAFTPQRWLGDGDQVHVGDVVLDVRHCPGHTPGHVVFYHSGMHIAFVGDVLFQGSIGRTDFPRGDYATLIASITQKLWPLGDEMRFVPGHGALSSFGAERKSNPFVADHILGIKRQ